MTDRRPIEITFPIEEVNEIAEREAHAKRYYRPVYTMHKWWARRLGSVFRTMILYSLADGSPKIRGERQSNLQGSGGPPHIDPANPDNLWEYYLEDVDFEGKTILDPFMGGGTSIVEALRLGCNAIGGELNPVAWFIVKKQVEAVDLNDLDRAFHNLEEEVAPEIKYFYETECPHCDEPADAMYFFWIKLLPCRNCGEDVALFKDYRLANSRSSKDSFYHVICPDCWNVFPTDDYQSLSTCGECQFEFVPNDAGNVSGKTYTCPHCAEQPEMSIIESVDRYGKPKEEIFAVEYYCPDTEEKGYKSATGFDRDRFSEASKKLDQRRDELPIPTQRRYKGASDRAHNHGYDTYDDMFNDRQLLCLSTILKAIGDLEDQNVKEFLLLAFSDTTTFNNMFCEYHKSANKIQGLYKRHTITARHAPVENNVWGTDEGAATFSTEFRKMKAGKEFCQNSYEKYVEDGQTKQRDGVGQIKGYVAEEPSQIGQPVEGVNDETYNVYLRCGTSEYLPLEDESVDAVITDPPYYDNVMYAEVADFYYVWLKQLLDDEYDHFTAELTPKASEIVSDPAKNVETYRDENHFITGLTNVFAESHGKLRDDGIMVFTFHHKETEGWSSVLRSVLNAGFYVTALYPIRGEMRGSTHIHNKANIEYDMIVVCRKREDEPEEVSWRSLEDDIYFRAEEEIERLEASGSRLTQGDIFAVTMGKCLEVFSQHYPNVTHDGEAMSVRNALERIREIVDNQLIEERIQILGEELDALSAIYLTYVLGRGNSISYNALNKDLRTRGVDVAELLNEDLLEQQGDKLVVLAPAERAADIESKRNPIAIDRAHYLRFLYENDRLAQEFGNWADTESITALRRLAQIENDDIYADIADYVEERTGKQVDLREFV